jgi:hypothetical protein
MKPPGGVAERLNAAALKVARGLRSLEGSNPSPSALRPAAIALLVAVLAAVAIAAVPAGAKRKPHRDWHPVPFRPPAGRAFHGVSDTFEGLPAVEHFQRQVGSHPAVLNDFFHWGTPLTTGALQRWRASGSRGFLSLSTAPGGQPEMIRPGQIARGVGDRYIVRLNQSIASSGETVYIRLMGEMNGYWNPYCGFNSDGTARGRGHSTKSYRKAWRRFTIIVRGGTLTGINHRLRQLGMPRLLQAPSNGDPIYRRDGVGKRLAHPRVAMVWNPQTISNPAIAANAPNRYWPGRRYVDWVGADIYSKFATPGVRAALTSFYRAHPGLPFVIPEYSPWNGDPGGAFVRWLFRWSQTHSRVRMLIYYRSVHPGTIYDINNYPDARHALRQILNEPRWVQYPDGKPQVPAGSQVLREARRRLPLSASPDPLQASG